MLTPLLIPGLLITGTDTGVGKTVIAGAIADWFRRRSFRAGVFKPCGSGCVRREDGLVHQDAEFLSHCAGSSHPVDVICPQRYEEPLAPAVAAERIKQPLDWAAVNRALRTVSRDSDFLVVEGVGGILVPMDAKHTFLDVARWLRIPAVVVARPGLGTLNHTLLTLTVLRAAGVQIAGIVINRYPSHPGLAEETNPRALEKFGKAPVLTLVPDTKQIISPELPDDIVAAIERVDWSRLAGVEEP